MIAMAQALSAALLEFVWQGLLAAFLLWTLLFILKNRPARARYLASCVVLAAMAMLPVITACLMYTMPTASQSHAGSVTGTPQTMRAAMPARAPASFGWAANRANSLARWALPLWSLGVLLFSLRLVWASRQISLLRRQAKPADAPLLAIVNGLGARMKLTQPVRVLVSAVADCPSVLGWIKPIVLMPAATVSGLTPQQLEAVLAHELAHILRYDYVVNMLQTVVETLLFYHPAVWWVSARIRQERELCCDDLAVDSCGDALCYARALTRLERLRVTMPRLALGSAGGPLLYRIQRLAGDAGWRPGPSKLPGILALSLGLICFALNMQWPARGQQQDSPAQEPAAVESGMPDEAGVQVDLGGASVIHREEVEYPEAAVEKGIQGTVVVEVTLDAAGMVSDARVLSGPPELRKTALQSVLQWHFTHDAAGSTRHVSLAFQLPVAGDALKRSPTQRSRKSEARALAEAKREQESVQALVEKRLAENMAEQARVLQGRQSDEAIELQIETRKLADLAELAQQESESASGKLAQGYAGSVRELENQLRAWQSHQRTLEDYTSSLAKVVPDGFYFPDFGTAGPNAFYFRGPSVAGRRLKSINIQGLTAESRDELLAKLPVHVGDLLAEDPMQKVEAAVKQFDEHLGLSIFTGRDGQVEIRITAPGSDDSLKLHQ